MEKRYFPGLDLCRFVLFMIGPVLHAAVFVPDSVSNADMMTIRAASGAFRMNAFFAISGFLAISASSDGWISRRLRQLGIPLLTGIIVIAPLWHVFMYLTHGSVVELKHPLHLWFLVTLIGLVLAFDLFRKARGWAWLLAKPGSRLAIIMLIGMAIYLLVITLTWGRYLKGYREALSFFFMFSVQFSFYLAGMLVAASPKWQDSLRRLSMWWIGFPVLLMYLCMRNIRWAMVGMSQDRDTLSWRLVVALAQFCTSAAMTLTIFTLALRVTRVSAALRPWIEASYSVYLLHFLYIGLLCIWGQHSGLSPWLLLVIYAAGSTVLSYATHRMIIMPFPVMRLLFNGTSPGPAPRRGRRAHRDPALGGRA